MGENAPSNTTDTYTLARNAKEAERLDKQSLAIEAALDYMVHPNIAATLPSNPTIADIGTGTGSYLIRLSKQYPVNSQFHGFDISPIQFHSNLPQNVVLHVQDVLKPFPPEFHGQFDLVHLRYLVLALNKDDWEVAARNAITLLRPGGAIQWEEADGTTARQYRGGAAGSTADNLRLPWKVFGQFNPRLAFGYTTLPRLFATMELREVLQDVVATDRVMANRAVITFESLRGIFGWARKVIESGVADPFPGRSLDDVERKAYEDAENGAYARYDLYCTIGFKASDTAL